MRFERLVNLKLRDKGLILVGVPVIFQLLVFATLNYLLQQSAADVEREASSRRIIATVEGLNNLLLEQPAIGSLYATTRNKSFARQLEQTSEQINKRLTLLHQMLRDRPQGLKLLNDAESIYHKEHSLLSGLVRAIDGESGELDFVRSIDLAQEPAKLIKDMSSSLEKLVQLEQEGLEERKISTTKSREATTTMLAFGVLLNLVLAFALALFFDRLTAQRIDVLMDNTLRMAKQQALNQPLQGKDEFAHLDRVFHKMAEGLAMVDKLKKEFVAMISHDLRAPLSSLQMFLSLLVDGTYGQLSTTGEQRGQNAVKSVAQLVKLINDLLDMEKLEAGRMEMSFRETELSSVIEHSVDSVRNLTVADQIKIEFAQTDLILAADGDRLVQVLINLISNAIKFSPPHGTIKILVEGNSERVRLSVTDEGSGVPAEFREMIFERFRQLPNQDKGGTGLGLPICKAIIEQHGGSIGVDSAVGQGSTFWFELPAQQVEQADHQREML